MTAFFHCRYFYYRELFISKHCAFIYYFFSILKGKVNRHSIIDDLTVFFLQHRINQVLPLIYVRNNVNFFTFSPVGQYCYEHIKNFVFLVGMYFSFLSF